MTAETASDRLVSHYKELWKALETLEDPTSDYEVRIKKAKQILAEALASQSPPLTDDVRVVSPDVAKWLESECNRYTNGKCTTRVCLRRGGWRGGAPDYSIATCEAHEARQALSAQFPPPTDGGQA